MATIAVIDDDKEIRTVLSEMLKAHGHDVITFADGAPFLAAVGGLEIDLVVTDLVMKTGGAEVVSQLQARGHRAPILVAAGHIPNDTACYLMANGAHQILEKPFPMSVLLQSVEKWLMLFADHMDKVER